MDNILPDTQEDHIFLFIYQHPKLQKCYTHKLRSKQYYLPLLKMGCCFWICFALCFFTWKNTGRITAQNFLMQIHKQGEESSPFSNHKFHSVSAWMKQASYNDRVNNSS